LPNNNDIMIGMHWQNGWGCMSLFTMM